jgi:hypothetical protein
MTFKRRTYEIGYPEITGIFDWKGAFVVESPYSTLYQSRGLGVAG